MASVENYIPYQPNAQGLTEALIDLKSTMPSQVVFKVTGYNTTCFEDVTQGQVLYSRASDGQVGKAIASDTLDKAIVAGVAETTKSPGQNVRVIVSGILANAGIDLIGSNQPNAWLRALYFGSQKRVPYRALHDIYPGFDCPVVDSYKNKLDWISIFP